MRDYLILQLEAPLMSFGAAQGNASLIEGDFVGQVAGVPAGAGMFPGRPMLTGLLGNALGYERYEGDRLQALSNRLRFAAALTRPGRLESDFQTSRLTVNDSGWTTRGAAEGRRGGAATYENAHLRRKLYWSETMAVVALRLADGPGEDLDAIATALERPERPLFIGRKTCVPSLPILAGGVGAADAHDALVEFLCDVGVWGVVWDRGEGPDDAPTTERDDRGWRNDVYQGSYPMHYRLPAPYGERHL